MVNGEIISREVAVHNEGQADLVIDSVTTSCSCTQATLTPMTIAPGETGILTISFDSGAHGPELTGELIRQVFVTSNDPAQPEAKVELTVFVDPNHHEHCTLTRSRRYIVQHSDFQPAP